MRGWLAAARRRWTSLRPQRTLRSTCRAVLRQISPDTPHAVSYILLNIRYIHRDYHARIYPIYLFRLARTEARKKSKVSNLNI